MSCAKGMIRRRLSHLVTRWALMIGLTGFAASVAHAAEDQSTPKVKIEVRSSIDDLWDGVKKRKPTPHGKTYAIGSLKQGPSDDPLVQPVDEHALLADIRAILTSQGFVEGDANHTPEIVLTVLYGRGFLKNPYVDYSGADEITDERTTSITSAKDAFRRREPGFEERMQRAQAEKLFITINAWNYPKAKKEKPKRIWQTMMIVDDPATSDLNQLGKQMLAAGGRYFDRDLDREEIWVTSSDREGRVILAPLRVLGAEKDTKPTPVEPAK
jgi:hypothetical protein